jgi:preprotein translocase SecE subunit
LARSADGSRRPRIRKSAPTVRERVEAARTKNETEQPGRARRTLGKISSPFKKLRLKDRRVFRYLGVPFRPLKKVLRWLVPRYFINSWRELRQVYWPNRRETWRLTLAVFIFAIVFGALVAGVDKGLDEVFKKVVLK